MGDKALRGNRLTAQGGGSIPGAARRAQEHGFYSPDMGMRGRFGYKHGGRTHNTRRENRLEELGRVDAERAYSRKGKRNLKEEKHRIRSELKKGGKADREIKTSKGQAGLWTTKARKEFKKGGTDKNWIQKAVNPKHKGFCTPMTKKTCTPRRKALARTFKKMGRERKAKG